MLDGLRRRTGAEIRQGPRSRPRYRYYVSQSVLNLGSEACPIKRVPAAEIEREVVDQLRRLLRSPEIMVATWRSVRTRIEGLRESGVRAAPERLGHYRSRACRRREGGQIPCVRFRAESISIVKFCAQVGENHREDPFLARKSPVATNSYQRSGTPLQPRQCARPEGIEKAADLVAITRTGCDIAQGFIFAHAMPKDFLIARLRADGAAQFGIPLQVPAPGHIIPV